MLPKNVYSKYRLRYASHAIDSGYVVLLARYCIGEQELSFQLKEIFDTPPPGKMSRDTEAAYMKLDKVLCTSFMFYCDIRFPFARSHKSIPHQLPSVVRQPDYGELR